jgi:cobalt-zinc-cadmium efflux system membrane fusion protein
MRKLSFILVLTLIGIVGWGGNGLVEDDHAGHGHDDHEGHAHAEGDDESPAAAESDEHEGHDHAERDEHAGHGHGNHADEDAIKLAAETMEEFGITMEIAREGRLDVHVTLPGEVHINQDRQAHIVPRYPGLVINVKKSIGDRVEKGDVLAILEGNDSLAPYALKSLIDGTIVEKHITLGESVDDDIVFTVADLNTVWIDLTVFQTDVHVIRSGMKVIVSGGKNMDPVSGTISYVSPTIDEHTRTGLARVVVPNPKGIWRPGMFVTGRVSFRSPEPLVLVPRDAVISIDGVLSVFVQTALGLVPRPVKLGIRGESRVEIIEGVQAGERFASRNVLPLKAEMNRAALEHAGHAH